MKNNTFWKILGGFAMIVGILAIVAKICDKLQEHCQCDDYCQDDVDENYMYVTTPADEKIQNDQEEDQDDEDDFDEKLEQAIQQELEELENDLA